MIMPTNGSGGIPPILQTAKAQNLSPSGVHSTSASNEAQFDRLRIHTAATEQRQFQQELASRLVKDIRTRHTTGDIQRIKEDIAQGRYRVDPQEIAKRLLLEGFAHEND